MLRQVLLAGLVLLAVDAVADGLDADQLGVIYNRTDALSSQVAAFYAAHRHVPAANLVGLGVPDRAVLSREELTSLRREMLEKLPTNVQSLLLVWSRPFAVECMSITTAFAAGYRASFCEPGCERTQANPLYDSPGWLPADSVGWLPAMLLPSADSALARDLIERGIRADGSRPPGTAYLVRTQDSARNGRAAGYEAAQAQLSGRLHLVELETPIAVPVPDIIAYFTGVSRVDELAKLHFRPGAAADHLTSTGGVLEGGRQMSALEWIRQGATGSYGTVSEPCSHLGKFPSPAVFLEHYLHGDTLLEAYWKSVEMPGQGLFLGEPLARPYPAQP